MDLDHTISAIAQGAAPAPETAAVLPASDPNAAHPMFEAQGPPSLFAPTESTHPTAPAPKVAAPAHDVSTMAPTPTVVEGLPERPESLHPVHQQMPPASTAPPPSATDFIPSPAPVATIHHPPAPQAQGDKAADGDNDGPPEPSFLPVPAVPSNAPGPAPVAAAAPFVPVLPTATATSSGMMVDEDSEPARGPAPSGGKGGRKGPGRGGRGGVITLKLLIDEEILEPGQDCLSVEYKGLSHTASLTAAGKIVLVMNGKEMIFESPSAFSIYLKRLVNPTRKADDGWKTVKYKGRLLEQFKGELLRKKLGDEGIDFEPSAKRTRFGSTLDSSSVASLDALRASAAASAAAEQEEEERYERPRRIRKAPPRFAAIGVDDEHALQPLEAYSAGQQPFAVKVSPAAEAVMDFHAHLCMNEVIGILAGTWDAAAKSILVLRAFPVKELATEDDSINVEMDPEAEFAAREEASKLGMTVVGWYHSHPTFATQPSRIDVYNQVLQQHHNREEATGAEPYIAAIVGPYDRRQPGLQSSMTWFYVDHTPGTIPEEGQRPEEIGCIAKALHIEQLVDDKGLESLTPLQRELENLAKRYAPLPDRAHLEGTWKDGHLRIEKLVASVQSRLPTSLGEAKLKTFGSKVYVSTRAVWNVYGLKVEAPVPVAAAAPSGDNDNNDVGAAAPVVAPTVLGGDATGAGGDAPGMVVSGSTGVLGGTGDVSGQPTDADDEPISEDDDDGDD